MLANPTYNPMAEPAGGFKSFAAFYPFYLGEHSLATTRRLHLVGTSVSLIGLTRVVASFVPSTLRYLARTLERERSAGQATGLQSRLQSWASQTANLSLNSRGKILLGGIVTAYAFAWVGHFFVEKNRPATFRYPLWSLAGDLKLWWEVVSGQRGI